jgi:hypothetical protein
VGERAGGKAFGTETLRLMLSFSGLLNKVLDLHGWLEFFKRLD